MTLAVPMDTVRWAWCGDCREWIGAKPPLLPPYWPASKSAAMHRAGTGHKVQMLTPSAIYGTAR